MTYSNFRYHRSVSADSRLQTMKNHDGKKKKNEKKRPVNKLQNLRTPTKVSKGDVSFEKEMKFSVPPQDPEKWYSSVPPDPQEFTPCPNDILTKLQNEARQMLDSEANGFNIRASKNSEQSWMRSIMAKGTGKDKIAAFTLMVQEKPLYNMSALQSLIGLVKPGKKECLACIDTLVELFISDLLPPETKLKRFTQRPLSMLEELSSGNPAGRRRRLILWFFEDQLKDVYREFIDSLRTIAAEAVEANKEKAVKAMAALLEAHPEQEAVLLSNIVNKMGDPSKKVASKAMHSLTQVLAKHPNMKGVIMDEVEKLLFRPNIGQKARYYSICFLSQIMFKKSDAQLAANLIKIYFSFFKACVKLGDIDSRMLSVLLSGVNRAYPYAREAMDSIAEQLETLYKVVHMAPFHVSLQGLSLLFMVADYKNNVSDRFYSVLYRKLLDPALCQTSHAPMFLNLTFQALKKDESVSRVRVFIKRLLQVCCHMPVPMICATLYMISQLIHKRSALSALTLEPSVKKEQNEIKIETNATLSAAFLDDDSGDEHYEDVPLEQGEDSRTKNKTTTSIESKAESKEEKPSAWVHKKEGSKRPTSDTFDPLQRNPLYANGDLCSFSELCLLSQHFHPTVALFASQILNSELVTYSGDPLKDFTLIRFLERFSFKNPKKQSEIQSNSLFAKRKNYSTSGLKGMSVTSSAYLKQEEGKVPVDEKFLFRFLQKRRIVAEEREQSQKDDDDSDVESVGSDEFEEMLDDLMKKKGLKKDIDDDFEEDLDFANEYSKSISAKKSKKTKVDEDDDGMDGSSDEMNESDDELNSENMSNDDENEDLDGDEELEGEENLEGDEDMPSDEDFDFDNLDDDAEDIDFDDEEEEEDSLERSTNQGKAKGKKSNSKDLDNDVFASAEEFSELLEAAGAAREGSSRAVSNKDKASLKQLNWEAERDRWVKGYKNFTKGGKGSGNGSKGKSFGVKKPSMKSKTKKRRF